MAEHTVTAFRWVPPQVQGLVRDLRVRWAMEEAGLPYRAQLIGPDDQKSAAYRKLQPFGQVPAFIDGSQEMFESGAIVLHIAEQSDALMPTTPEARTSVVTWMFASLNTVEPPIMMRAILGQRYSGTAELRKDIESAIKMRLQVVGDFLGDRDYLVADRFTAADLLMTTVLTILRDTDIVAGIPTLEAYRKRGESRPAYERALAAQLKDFATHAPAAPAT